MAMSMCRTGANIVRRSVLISSARASSGGGPPIDQHKGKVASEDVTMADGLGHAVGDERYEKLAKLAGIADPFEMNVKRRNKGTLEEPNLIPSMFDKRLVGCICEEDALSISWMKLHKGEPKRCMCGYWFKLTPLQQNIS